MAITYEVLPPAPPLAAYVECYWSLRGDAADLGPGPERVLPDGRVEVVLNLGGAVRQDVAGASRLQPAEMVIGATTRAVLIRPAGRVHNFGVRFRHGGAYRLLAVSLAALTDDIVPLDDVRRLFPATFREQLHEAGEARAQARLVDGQLIRQLTRLTTGRHSPAAPAAGLAAHAARMILAAGGAVTVDHVAAAAGVSGRQLVRRFHTEVGVGPKVLARLARFHSVLRIVAARRAPTLAAAAARAGYVDQSHLRRDFRDFTGETPSSFLRSRHELSALFFGLEAPGA